MAEGDEAAAVQQPGEPAEAPACDVLEEDALDRILRAEGQDLLSGRLDQVRHARHLGR